MLSTAAINAILGIADEHPLTSKEMACHMKVTFYNNKEAHVDTNILNFADKLEGVLLELGVKVVPYEEALVSISWRKICKRVLNIILNDSAFFVKSVLQQQSIANPYIPLAVIRNTIFNRRRIRSGISVIALGELQEHELPMNYTSSFRDTSIITIVKLPPNITKETNFETHFNTAMDFFARDMTNIVIAVGDEYFIVYNFNASHPVYQLNDNKFEEHILEALIPKVVAPIRPHRFADFTETHGRFSITDPKYERGISEFVLGGKLFAQTNLYPKGKKLDDLPFRNSFHRWIGKIHLDNRNGMSYGFLAWQLPSALSEIHEVDEKFIHKHPTYTVDKDFFYEENNLHIVIEMAGKKISMKVPDIWVLSQRSGSDKTNIRPEKDLVKMGLSGGKMLLEAPIGLDLDNSYKPSFDTKVILAHAVGNAIIASVANYLNIYPDLVNKVENNGMAIAHWHGYLNPNEMPLGFHYYGFANPHVSCSSPQSAIYALDGKLNMFKNVVKNGEEYKGDIQLEPQHGSNMNFSSIIELAELFIQNPQLTELGNKYLPLYEK